MGIAIFIDTRSAVSLAGVCELPTKSALAGVQALPAHTGRRTGFLPISAGKASELCELVYDISYIL